MPAGSGVGGRILDGFSISTSLAATYDSNITQSPGLPQFPVEDDIFLTLGGTLNYLSKSSDLTFGGNYHGSYNEYFSHPDFSGYSQGAGLVSNYEGGRFTASLAGGVEFAHGSNRNYGSALVDQTNFNTSLSVRYRLSPKTSLAGNIGQNFSTASGGNFNDTTSFDAGASALWKYSPLTEFGPGLRYTYRSGDSQGGRTSIGPTLSMNYKLSTKVSLNSRVGVDFASYENGGSADPAFSTSIGLDYRASKLWGLNFSLFRDAEADPSLAGGYYQVTSWRLGYDRKIRRATLNLGMSYESTVYDTPETTGMGGTAQPDRNYLSLDASLGMRILSNTSFASVFMRYSDQSGGPVGSWDSVQTGLSISRSF